MTTESVSVVVPMTWQLDGSLFVVAFTAKAMASWHEESTYLISPLEELMQFPASPESLDPSNCSDDSGLGLTEVAITPTNRENNRTSTYAKRKEDTEKLTKVIGELEERLQQMEMRHVKQQLPLRASLAANSLLLASVEESRRTIATTQSMIGPCVSQRDQLPFESVIRLPKDEALRNQLIRDMKPQKTHDAVQYLLQRCQFLDLGSPSRQLEHFVTASGDHVSLHWEVAVFDEDSPSVANIYSDMLYFVPNEEMEMAEKLGITSARESNRIHDGSDADQVRLVSTHHDGLLVEKNVVVHSQFFQQSELLRQPHGIVTVDFVNEDDAFPYQPETRIRKDIVAATLVMEAPPLSLDDPPRVALVRWGYVKLHHTPLASKHTMDHLSREIAVADFDIMVAGIRDRSAWRNLAGVFI